MTMYSNSFEQSRKSGVPEEYESQFIRREEPQAEPAYQPPAPAEEPQAVPVSAKPVGDGILSKAMSLFRGLEFDDILLIAIGVLLLLDSDEDNDVIVIFIALMLFF